jgi:hypothetical protein
MDLPYIVQNHPLVIKKEQSIILNIERTKLVSKYVKFNPLDPFEYRHCHFGFLNLWVREGKKMKLVAGGNSELLILNVNQEYFNRGICEFL